MAAYRNGIASLVAHGRDLVEKKIAEDRRRLSTASASWVFRHPERLLEDRSQRLDRAVQGLHDGIVNAQKEKGQRLSLAAARLQALSPLAVLVRGYSITQKRDRSVVKSVDDVAVGEPVMTRVADGALISVVQKVVRSKANE